MDYEDLAKEVQGNWKSFNDFSWHNPPKDADLYGHVVLSNRDSGLREQSNEAAILKGLKKYRGWIDGRANHWGVSWINFIAIKVRHKNGKLTRAFIEWAELHSCIEEHCVIDSADYSRREYEATIKHIEDKAWALCDNWPKDWSTKVWKWLWDHMQVELESVEDQGGQPSLESIETAARALGWVIEDDDL